MLEYNSAAELASIAMDEKCSMGRIVMRRESEQAGIPIKDVYSAMLDRVQVMKESIEKGLREPLSTVSELVGTMGQSVEQARTQGRLLGGDLFNKVIARALSVAELNACMGRVVACPTAGSCGIVPACVLTVGEDIGADEEAIAMAMFTLGGLGSLTAARAPIAGAEGGCQAECGVASAMAAAGVAELLGCNPEQVLDAASFGLQHFLGLVCDPVAGLVEVPCVTRNAAAAANAIACANMVVAGVRSTIPFDETVIAMAEISKVMPETLRETSEGGLATTPTGRRIAEKLSRVDWLE